MEAGESPANTMLQRIQLLEAQLEVCHASMSGKQQCRPGRTGMPANLLAELRSVQTHPCNVEGFLFIKDGGASVLNASRKPKRRFSNPLSLPHHGRACPVKLKGKQ